VTLVLERINYADMEKHLVISFLMIGCGMYSFGLKCLFSIEKNRFLKAVSFIACLFISFGSILMFYFSMNQTDTVLIVYGISMFLFTLIVLLSLPVSGYVQWSSQHKSILKKILIPWIFFLLLISIRFVFPDLNSLFFRKERGEFQEFMLYDYPITDKNGLEPE
jgi:membrane-bound ClpP family serine protease